MNRALLMVLLGLPLSPEATGSDPGSDTERGTSAAAPANRVASDRLFAPVAAILQARCIRCHNAVDRKGSLSLQSGSAVRESGQVIAGQPQESGLMTAIVSLNGARPTMPQSGTVLSEEEVAAIREWIAGGAVWPESAVIEEAAVTDADWWSLQPLVRPAVPPVSSSQAAWISTPIDAFVLHSLDAQGLTPSPPADRRTLIRRLSFDLTGLPPTPAEVDAFVNSEDPLAWESLVDRLLESPACGERWARHWLDIVKYADTCGYDKDKLRPNAWPYRDYVIQSLNQDKPWSRFVQEQIAGDVLFPESAEALTGLGFLAAGPWDWIGHAEVPESKTDGKVARHIDRDEMVSNTLNTFCSVTIQCCQCHNHKFDPFTQEHYFNLQSVFAAVDRADRPWEPDPLIREQRRTLTAQRGAAQAALDALRQPAANGNAKHDHLTTEKSLEQQIAQADKELHKLPPVQMVYAAATEFSPLGSFVPTRGNPRTIHVLHRGNVSQPLAVARPGTIPLPLRSDESGASDAVELTDAAGAPSGVTVRCDAQGRFDLPENHSEGDRRAALARWLTRRDHPLMWRSIVNRVWQYHFGHGLSDTPNDFGRMGQPPSHPELLDWLAIEFRDGGESLRALHRLIVLSSVYRQSSAMRTEAAAVDPDNRLLWRMDRRRLEAEEIRDAMLFVSGRLDRRMGGPGYYLFVLERPEHSPHFEYHKFDANTAESHRRSIYRFVVRSQPDPYLTTLDCADSSMSTPQRTETLTSLQALSLLNNSFSLAMARHFAGDLQQHSSDRVEQVRLGFRRVTGRLPTESEQAQLVEYAERSGQENLCRVLLNLSEFVYLD